MISSINEVVSQLMVIKNSLVSPDTIALVNAIGVITTAVEKLCASVYFALLSLGSSNEVLKVPSFKFILVLIQIGTNHGDNAMFYPLLYATSHCGRFKGNVSPYCEP